MPVLMTCRGCTKVSDCDRRAKLVEAVRGLGVTSIKHRCPDKTLAFTPGQAVWVEVNDAPWSECAEFDEPTRAWFPGVFIGGSTKSNTRGLVFVRSGETDRSGDFEFDPINGGKGGELRYSVCKVIWSRIEARERDPYDLCRECGLPIALTDTCDYSLEGHSCMSARQAESEGGDR